MRNEYPAQHVDAAPEEHQDTVERTLKFQMLRFYEKAARIPRKHLRRAVIIKQMFYFVKVLV
jgi:hypothetical protein